MTTTHIKPTIGRIVYYRGKDGETRAAIVTAVNGDFNLNLFVFPQEIKDADMGLYANVTHADPEIEPGCFPSWHWMPYQKEQAAKHAGATEAATGGIGGVSGSTYDPAEQQAYIQRHQREQALHLAISTRQQHETTADVLDNAAKLLSFMQGGA